MERRPMMWFCSSTSLSSQPLQHRSHRTAFCENLAQPSSLFDPASSDERVVLATDSDVTVCRFQSMGVTALTRGRKPRLIEAVLMREILALVQYLCLQR